MRRTFELVDPDDPRLGGRPGRRMADDHWLWARGHATQRLVDTLNRHHRRIFRRRLWRRGDKPVAAERRYRFAEPGELPAGVPCIGAEKPGSFVWIVEPGQMSRELMSLMNAWLDDPEGGGMWGQHWDGR